MNEEGKNFCKLLNKRVKNIHSFQKEMRFKTPRWEDSLFHERLLRMGREIKIFDVDMTDSQEVINIVIASFQQDFVEKFIGTFISEIDNEKLLEILNN
jgi:hypothetical protein